MKKTGLIMLLIVILSFSLSATAIYLEEYINSQENILNIFTVESQAVSASAFGGDFSLYGSEQIDFHFYNNETKAYITSVYNEDNVIIPNCFDCTLATHNVVADNGYELYLIMIFGGDLLLNAVLA